ncbi:hypothetical protein FAVG1_02698 [Fusarium avenaceum]|nr:hypothetical protein FAVG1_02698 [Fusarium avenaceum]
MAGTEPIGKSDQLPEQMASHPQGESSDGILPGDHWMQTANDRQQDDDDADSTLSDDASSTASLTSEILKYRTGTGIWAMDFADEFPNVKVIGTDLSPIQPSWLPPNLEFQIDDCTQEWTFQESSLDYVHMRFLVGSIVDWTALYKQAYKCLKPGGWIESHEAGPTIKSDDDSILAESAMGQWGKLFLEGGRRLQRPFSILEDDVQRQGMEEAGFTSIHEEEVKLPIGGWSSDPKTKEAGQYFQAAILQDVEGTLMFIANLLGWAKEEIHVFAARYRREIKSKNHHGYFLGKVVWAQKPYDA